MYHAHGTPTCRGHSRRCLARIVREALGRRWRGRAAVSVKQHHSDSGMAIGRTRSEVRLRFDRGSTGDIRCSVEPVPTCSKIKGSTESDRSGVEICRSRSVWTFESDRQLLQENCYGVRHPIKLVPVTFQLLLGAIVDTSTCCGSLH
jgi:hypothetical protein